VLISRRKEGEAVFIGEGVEIRIVSVRKRKVVLGIIAPRERKITTAKLSEAEIANTIAAANSINIDQFLRPQPGEHVSFLLGAVLGSNAESQWPMRNMEDQNE
jgi:carbon storage regulator CsrA